MFQGRGTKLILILGFVCFLALYSLKSPGAHLKGYVLSGGLVAALVASWLLGWKLDESLVLGLVFAVPMADQLIFPSTILGRMVEDALLYILIPLGLLLLIRRGLKLSEVGLSKGKGRNTVITTCALIALAVAMAFTGLFFPSMTAYYPVWQKAPTAGPLEFAYNESIIAVMMLSGEFFFRGLVLFTLAGRSYWGAILFQSLPYAFLHLGKPPIEVPYSLVAGIIFGWANLRTRSILPSLITHFGGSALFDALILLT